MTDEIIAEVWAAKDALSEQHGGSLRALYAAIKRGEAELAAKGIRVNRDIAGGNVHQHAAVEAVVHRGRRADGPDR